MPPRGAASLAARFGQTSAVMRALGVTLAELEVIVAIAACERVAGNPTAAAIRQVTGRKGHHLIGDMAGRGLIENLGRTKEGVAFYGVTRRGLELIGLDEGEAA